MWKKIFKIDNFFIIIIKKGNFYAFLKINLKRKTNKKNDIKRLKFLLISLVFNIENKKF